MAPGSTLFSLSILVPEQSLDIVPTNKVHRVKQVKGRHPPYSRRKSTLGLPILHTEPPCNVPGRKDSKANKDVLANCMAIWGVTV